MSLRIVRDDDARIEAAEELEAAQHRQAMLELKGAIAELREEARRLQAGVPGPGDLERLMRLSVRLAALEYFEERCEF